jgi:hypothetical protein
VEIVNPPGDQRGYNPDDADKSRATVGESVRIQNRVLQLIDPERFTEDTPDDPVVQNGYVVTNPPPETLLGVPVLMIAGLRARPSLERPQGIAEAGSSAATRLSKEPDK